MMGLLAVPSRRGFRRRWVIYLPLQLTTPILVGGFLSHLVNKRGEKVGGDNTATPSASAASLLPAA
jgi:uncharacterized oligopeptide transporter (OPT) family protein